MPTDNIKYTKPMKDRERIFSEIDVLIETIDQYKEDNIFDEEIKRRQDRVVTDISDDNKILRTLSHLIAYSQNANSEKVEQVLKSGLFDKAFNDFKIDKVINLNPCDIADNHWDSIQGIRQQAKIFHIVSLARKIKKLGGFKTILNDAQIPKKITSNNDINEFWKGFDELLKKLINAKIPFFRSTTSLLHLLLDMGYDCAKPDLVVMKVAKKLSIVDNESGDKNLRQAIRFMQEYSLNREIKPSVVDFYFLIEGQQKGAEKYVSENFYRRH